MPCYHLGAYPLPLSGISCYHLAAASLPLTPPRLYARSTPPDLHSSTPPCPRARSMPPKLPISIPRHIHVPTLAANSQSSRARSVPPLLHVPTPAPRPHSSRSLYLYASTSLHLHWLDGARKANILEGCTSLHSRASVLYPPTYGEGEKGIGSH